LYYDGDGYPYTYKDTYNVLQTEGPYILATYGGNVYSQRMMEFIGATGSGATTDYVLLNYLSTYASSFIGYVRVRRGDAGAGPTMYTAYIDTQTAYSPTVIATGWAGHTNIDNIVSLTYAGNTYVALEVYTGNASYVSVDGFYGTNDSGATFKPFMVSSGSVSGVTLQKTLTNI